MSPDLWFIVTLSALLSGTVTYFYYFRKRRDRAWWLPAGFRFLAIFCLVLLLFDLSYSRQNWVTHKTALYVALDNSRSITLGDQASTMRSVYQRLAQHKELNQLFDVEFFLFGDRLRPVDSLDFEDGQTRIHDALSGFGDLSKSGTSAVILISDGVQTSGRNYAYSTARQKIHGLALGDTVQRSDLSIDQVNVNRFVTLGNSYEIEIHLSYSGPGEESVMLEIRQGAELVRRESLRFSEQVRSLQMMIELEADEVGKHLYSIEVGRLKGEEQIQNNRRVFEVEVVDKKVQIALVHAFPHPDLGMIKNSIERRERNEVVLIPVDEWSQEHEDYPMHLIYQPDERFETVFQAMDDGEKDYMLIAGDQSDWDFINRIQSAFEKEASLLEESYYPVMSKDFQTFYLEDIGFDDFPALSTSMGSVQFSVPSENILTGRVNGILTDKPILSVYREGQRRRVVFFAGDLWKWRMTSFRQEGSFDRFDQFFGSLIQYLKLSDKQTKLELFYDPSSYSDQEKRIRARKYDSNLNLDLSSVLELTLNPDADPRRLPMYVSNSYYEVNLNDLEPGTHMFRVNDQETGRHAQGQFVVLPYSAEQLRLTSDVSGLRELTSRTGGELFFPSQLDSLIKSLTANPDFRPVEKESMEPVSLIDEKWLFALIVLSLTIEWIIRKYRGLI